VAGLYVWLTMLKSVPARIAASTQSLQPIFGIGGSTLLLGEPLTLQFTTGAALVLAGIAFAVVPGRRA
jgi:drug/metabolite transporter (DMT)-like permease